MEFEFMRLWSIHPKYLDTVGLVALWRESLLAQKVLKGGTKGYKNHPQLKRFRKHPSPLNAIASYLMEVWKESKNRGYSFNKMKISKRRARRKIPVTPTELKKEFDWLCTKLKQRESRKYIDLLLVKRIDCHPIFKISKGRKKVLKQRTMREC
jgi:hypothetical protein